MKIFVISLLRSPERRERIGRLLEEQNIEFKFFNAIDGSEG
ncbi:glycosyltransferase family 25 protein, partial [Vibrio alfacsensis]